MLRRWLVEHQRETEFSHVIKKLDRILEDQYVDRFESKEIIDTLGHTLKLLRTAT